MENITLKIKIGTIEEPAPFVFDDSLDLGRVNTQVLILKDYLNENLSSSLYVGENNCATPISWQEGPYFDKKTRYALYTYQKQESVKLNIINFIINSTLEPSLSEASIKAEEIYHKQLGTMSLATIAVMHGYVATEGTGPIIEPVFLNKRFTTNEEYIEGEPEDVPASKLYKSTAKILNLINDAALGEYGSFEQAALTVTRSNNEESNPRSSVEFFQRPDPNIIGIDDIKSDPPVKDEYFELDGNKIGLYIPSAENVENSYTLANPPKLQDESWNNHATQASKRALKEIMLQLYNIDITQPGVFEASMVDDIYQALFPELTEYTTLSGPMLIYEDLIKPSDEESPFRIYFEFNFDQLYDYLINFIDKLGTPSKKDPILKYLGFTTPSFRPGAIYKDEFVFNKRKLEFIKDSISINPPADETLTGPARIAAEQVEIIESINNSAAFNSEIVRDTNDICIENEVKNYFSTEGAIKSVVNMTERELKENVRKVIDRTREDIQREYAVEQSRISQTDVIKKPSNFGDTAASSPDWLLGGKAFATARGSMGMRSEGQNDVGTVTPMQAMWPNQQPPLPEGYNPEEIKGYYSDFKTKIAKVAKIFKKAQKELEEFEEGNDRKIIVPKIDLKKEAKKLEDFLGMLGNSLEFWQNPSNPQLNDLDSDDIYFRIKTRSSTSKRGFLEFRTIEAHVTNKKQSASVGMQGAYQAKDYGSEKMFDPSYTVGYLAALDQIIAFYNVNDMALGGCFSFMKPVRSVALVQSFTVPRPHFAPNELSEEWPPMTGPIKTASDQAKDQFTNYLLSFQKGFDEWADEYQAKVDARDPIPNFSDEFNKVCNLEKLYAKVLDKLNIGSLICQVLKCMGLWPVAIDLNLSLILPKIPKMPTFDPLGYLGKIIYKAIIQVLAQTLCKLVQAILDLLKLDCRGPDINLADRPDYGNAGPQNIPLGARQLAQAATDIGLPEELFDDSKDFVSDLSSLLSPSELCSLYSGNATGVVIQLASNLIERKFTTTGAPSLAAYLSDPDDMKVFFAKLGVLGASEVCDTLQQTLEQLPPEFDKPDDCACIDGEQLRDKLLRDKYASEAGVTPQALKDALDRAKRNKELAKKAFEDLAAGRMLDKVVPELSDFSNPASPLFDIPASFKGIIKTAVEGTLEAVKSQYYNDIRLYVPYLYSENIKIDADSQTSPGANKMQEARKISTVETLRNYNFWLSIIRPDDFDPSQISKRDINQLYALYCLLYPVYKERYVAKVPGSEVFYLNEHISEERHIQDAIQELHRVNNLDGVNSKLDTMEKVIELYPSPYAEPSNSQEYTFAVKPSEYVNSPRNYISNATIARSYNGAINPRSALKSVKLLNKMRGDLKGLFNQTRQGRDWNVRESQGVIQMFAFVGNDGEWLQLESDQNYFRAPIMIGCSPPDLTAMHDGDEIDGEDIPFGFTKTFNIDSYTKDKLDKSSFLKTEILKKISERIQSLMSELTDLFAQSQSSGFTSGASGATKVVNEYLPKIKPLFNKESEIKREKTSTAMMDSYDLGEMSTDSEVVNYYGSTGVELKAPATLNNLAELMLSRIEGDNQYDDMVENIKRQSEGHMRFTFGSADGSGNDENIRQINTTFSVIQDPHFTRLSNESDPIILQSCKIIPVSLMSDEELNNIYTPGYGYSRTPDKPNALNLYTGMIISGSQEMFDKHNLDMRVFDDQSGPFGWLENTYSVSLETYFEDVFDQIFDSPFISSESYIESIRKKLTGTPFVKDEVDASGCSLEQKGYEPVKILIDFEREVDAALSRVVKRMRKPNSFRNIDFKNPSPFEEGIRDTVILLFMKILMYEFALRAGPAMSAFKATDVLRHDYVPQFIADWILNHEIYNLKFFKKNPGFREVFEKSLIDTTGKSNAKDALLEILSQELPDVATRVDKLFDSYIEDSPSSFLQRMPYGSVFSVASVRQSKTPGNKSISSGRKFINLSYTETGTIERDLVSYEALGVGSGSGIGADSSPAFDYALKGGYILESFVKIKGPMAIEYQKFFLKFEAVQEELKEIIDEAGDDISQQANVDVSFDRLEEDEENLKDEIIVSLSEFRDYLQGDIIKPLLDNLGIDLTELGYSEECGLRPKFTEGYPSVPIKIKRNHTVIDSRHTDWLNTTPLLAASTGGSANNRTISAESFDSVWNKYVGTVVPWHSGSADDDKETSRQAVEKQGSSYSRHYIMPKNLCPFLNSAKKEEDLQGALLDSESIINNGIRGSDGSYSNFNDLLLSNTTSPQNYNFDFNFFSRKITDTNTRDNQSAERFRFTNLSPIDTSKLEIDVTDIDNSEYNISSKIRLYPTGSSIRGSVNSATGFFEEGDSSAEYNYEEIKNQLGEMSFPRSYSNDEFEKILKPVLRKMQGSHRASVVFDNLATPTKEQYEQLHESLSYSRKFGGIYKSPDPNLSTSVGNYLFSEEDWDELVEQEYGNSYQVWNQHVVDVIGFAAPMLDVGETFHASEDLPTINSHLKKIIKTADGFQFWKKYLSSPNHFFNHARTPGMIDLDNDKYAMGSHIVENQKFNGGYTRYDTDRHHPDYVLANELNPDNIIKKIFSNAERTERYYDAMSYSGVNQYIRPLAAPYFGPTHDHASLDGADYEDYLSKPANEDYDMFTMPINHRVSLSTFPTIENVTSGMYDTTEEQSGIIERNYIFNKRSKVATRCNTDSPDDQACFFMSTFDKKLDGTIKMSRPLGVTPTFFSSGTSWKTPMADQSWTELRAYSPDIHIDFKWTYVEDSSPNKYSFSDDHMFNSCIKTIYPKEAYLINARARIRENHRTDIKKAFVDGNDDNMTRRPPVDSYEGTDTQFSFKWKQYYNVEDHDFAAYNFDSREWEHPGRPFKMSDNEVATTYGVRNTILSQHLFDKWKGNIWQSEDYEPGGNSAIDTIINMEGSFSNYNLARRFSSVEKLHDAIDHEANSYSEEWTPGVKGTTYEDLGGLLQNELTDVFKHSRHTYGYYGDALMQLQKICDWSLHNVYHFSPTGWKMHNVANGTSAKTDRGSFATGFKDEEAWFSGRITNGDVGKYIKLPYNLGTINSNNNKGDIYKEQNNYGYRSSFGYYNLAYNQVLYPLPFGSSLYANVTKLFKSNPDRTHDVLTGEDFDAQWHKPKERFFKIPYRRITPSTFGSPVERTMHDKGHPLYEGIEYGIRSDLVNTAGTLNPAYRFKQWTERYDSEIRKVLRNSSPVREYEDESESHRNQALGMIKEKYKIIWNLQNFYATKKLPPLTYFQKNLRKNHHHSPNQVRTPLRLFFTRVDYYYNGEVQQDKTKVLFSYDIPHTLKGAETKFDSQTNKLKPISSQYRKELLQRGLEYACYEYLDYSKLERFAMRSPMNGTNILKMLDKETSNALSMTWYTPHPIFMNEPPSSFHDVSDSATSVRMSYPAGGSDAVPFDPQENSSIRDKGYSHLRSRTTYEKEGGKKHLEHLSTLDETGVALTKARWIASDTPSANLGIVTVPWQAKPYGNEVLDIGIDGNDRMNMASWFAASKGDAPPGRTASGPKTAIAKRRYKWGTGLYYMDRLSKALHGELVDYDYNPAISEGVGVSPSAAMKKKVSSYEHSPRKYQFKSKAADDLFDAIFFSTCGIPHGGPFVFHTDLRGGDYVPTIATTFGQRVDEHMKTHFNPFGAMNFTRDLEFKNEERVIKEFERSLRDRYSDRWMTSPRQGCGNHHFKKFDYSASETDGSFPSGHYPHLITDIGTLLTAKRDIPYTDNYALHQQSKAFKKYVGRSEGDRNRDTDHGSLVEKHNDQGSTYSFGKFHNQYYTSAIERKSIKDYTYAPLAGSYFYNPLSGYVSDSNMANKNQEIYTKNNLTNYSRQEWGKTMIDPFMSFCGHTNLMQSDYVEVQFNRSAFTENNLAGEWSEEAFKDQLVGSARMSKGFVTVSKIYSLAAHQEVYDGYLDKKYTVNGLRVNQQISEEARSKNSFMTQPDFVDQQLFSLQSIELTSVDVGIEKALGLDEAGGIAQSIPNMTNYGQDMTHVQNSSGMYSSFYRSNGVSDYIFPVTAKMQARITKYQYENYPTTLSQNLYRTGEKLKASDVVVPHSYYEGHGSPDFSDEGIQEQEAYIRVSQAAINFRKLITGVIKNHVAAKNEFGAWARMSCKAWLSGEVPEEKYLQNSEFFMQQSDLSYSPAQVLPNRPSFHERGSGHESRIYRWRDLYDASPSEISLSDNAHKLNVRLGNYMVVNGSDETTRPLKVDKPDLNENYVNKSLLSNSLKISENILSDESTQLPLSVREKINELKNEMNINNSDLLDRFEKSIYGKTENGERTPATEIYSGLRLVKLLDSGSSRRWLESNQANSLESMEKAHLSERSFYVDLRDRTLKESKSNILMHMPIYEALSPICLPGGPDSGGDLEQWLQDQLNMDSSIIRQCITENHEKIKTAAVLKLISDYIYPTSDAQAAAAIYSSMTLTSQDKMHKLLTPTKNAFLNIVNSIGNKAQDPISGIWQAPPPVSNAEYEVFLKNVGTGGPKVPCGGMPGFDAEEFFERILDLIIQLPASILTTLAMLLDPGYRVMHQRFQSCSPADQHIKSLDWGAVATATEYGWGIEVDKLSQGTLGGNVPKGGKYANVLYSFPVDLFAGINFLFGPPFIMFNPSFGMAFVKLANYILGSVGVGSGAGGGLNTPCFGADLDASASTSLLDGKNGYGHPLLVFGPLALTVNSWPFLRLPADDPSEQAKLCKTLEGPVGAQNGSNVDMNKRINSGCDPE